MSKGRPSLVAIDHDDYHAEHVGHTSDGRQFMLTRPFDPAVGNHAGSEFVALYLFDSSGQLIEASIDNFGPRLSADRDTMRETHAAKLAGLGKVSFE